MENSNNRYKFRAWHKRKQSMMSVEFWDFKDGIDLVDKDGKGYYCSTLVDLEIMQYTGLKDKSGKEIYEGDIVRYMSFYPDESWGGEQMVITWNNDISGFNTPFNHNFNCQVDRVSLEVIGNIYENEDLVERV